MQIGSRFTEYGLTGGFFWICQFILLWRSGQTQTLLSNLSTVQLQIAKDIPIPITSLVSALAIIAVFVTGLLLDLFAVYFRPMGDTRLPSTLSPQPRLGGSTDCGSQRLL